MKKIRKVLLTQGLLFLGLFHFIVLSVNATDSITKVGNGNDGADLESLTPIKSGPIWESREQAIKLLNKLNVIGVPGLGILISEIERTELLMAANDVHPTGEQRGSLEISEDKTLVYARTFAEPNAATRFFPAARKLTSNQLVALQIHEALHRALPAHIRTDENVVMHYTMAMTSPGASYDRIRQVSEIYINERNEKIASEQNSATAIPENEIIFPARSRTTIGYSYESYSYENYSLEAPANPLHRIELNKSLGYKSIFGAAVESVFRARLLIDKDFKDKSLLGPSSFDLEARFQLDEFSVAGPVVRFTTKSIDETSSYDSRDLMTIGGFYRSKNENFHFDSTIEIALPSTLQSDNASTKYQAIISLLSHSSYKFKNGFALGGLAEVHSTEGSETETKVYNSDPYSAKTNAFRNIFVGPELGFESKNLQIKMYWKYLINNSSASMDNLGDRMDHGFGKGSLGTSLTIRL